MTIRIILVDDHAVVRMGLRMLLENESDFNRFALGEDRITVPFSSGMTNIDSLHIGKKNPTGSFSFVRINNESNVYLTDASIVNSIDKSLYNFRDKTILELSRDDVKRITRLKGKEKIVLKRDFGKNFEIIEPQETRPKLIRALEMLENKVDSNPRKKHGNIPL